jgi:hypothetical protein
MRQRTVIISLVAAAVLVIARIAVFLIWEQSAFDSDQAIFGLMAKHIVEGRAFPVFIYGDNYMLALQAWLAAPLFAIFGPSVAVLKIPVALVNVATAMLLVWILIRDAKLTPAIAFVASLFFILMPPVMSKLLVETGGGNPEPFLYVLVLWLLRDRPIAFGIVFALGFLHREFTAYGVSAIVVISLLADRRMTAERLKGVAIAAISYLAVSQIVRTAFVFSNPYGPGTTVPAFATNASALAARYCWAPETIAPGLRALFTSFMGVPFGATQYPMLDFGVRSLLPTIPLGLPPYWLVLGSIFSIALGRVVWIALRDRAPIWKGPAAVGTFLLLIGLQSGVAYAIARCGRLEPGTSRYALLMLYTGVGIMALYFIYERHRALRGAMVAVMIAWATISAASHAALLDEYLHRRPGAPHRTLAKFLVDHDIRYARADYWTAYATTFLTGEKTIIASTDTVRITSYQSEVAANDAHAVLVQRQPCSGPGAEAVMGNYWVCEPKK